jgi:hypothetical protein
MDALFQNLVTRQEHALHLFRITLVEEQDRVNVAVAGVEDVGDAQIVLAADLLNETKDVRQFCARDDPILRAVTRRESSDGAECLLARFPEQEALGVGVGPAHFAGTVLLRNRDDRFGVSV